MIYSAVTKARKQSAPKLKNRPGLLVDNAFWEAFSRKMEKVREELAAKRKDAVLHLRINSRDLARLKEKAAASGTRYQTFIAEILKRAAQS